MNNNDYTYTCCLRCEHSRNTLNGLFCERKGGMVEHQGQRTVCPMMKF